MKDVISAFLVNDGAFGMDDAYETACDLADDIFDEFDISEDDQDLEDKTLKVS